MRCAEPADAEAIGRLLHDFNREFGDPTPGPRAVADRIRELLDAGEIMVLLAGEGPDGLAVMRFRPTLTSDGLDCYLEELYVVPDRRGHGTRPLRKPRLQQPRGPARRPAQLLYEREL